METLLPNDLTIHVALSSLPQNSNSQASFLDVIEKNLYTEYVNGSLKYFKNAEQAKEYYQNGKESNKNILYSPLKYFLFGTFDVAFISLVDRYKFSQKLFFPKSQKKESSEKFSPSSFQTFTGITQVIGDANNYSLRDFFEAQVENLQVPQKLPFLTISNLKLNNSLLIGNGRFLLDKVINELNQRLKRVLGEEESFLILESYSWFELSILFFIKSPSKVSELLIELRELKLGDLPDYNDFVESSLYFQLGWGNAGSNIKHEAIQNSRIFIDTHSYVGVRTECVQNEALFKQLVSSNIELSSEIEWLVKPGYLKNLIEKLRQDPNLKDVFKYDEVKTLLGQSDYLIHTKNSQLSNNLKLFRSISQNNSDLFYYVRKIKTKLLFNNPKAPKGKQKAPLSSGPVYFRYTLSKFSIANETIHKINEDLKALKVSRQIRSKVIKIFYNYNNGIQDPILYTFFLDFRIFIYNLIDLIEKENSLFLDTWRNIEPSQNLDLQKFERKLFKHIDIFQEGFNIRMLNCYQYEDINDFDLDFNSSIQQILTTYNYLAFCIGDNLFYESKHAPMIQLNFKNTVANYYSINYNIYHLLSPEFVFFTITKELMNHFSYDKSEETKEKILSLKGNLTSTLREQPYFADFLTAGLIDFDYLYIDAINYLTTCNVDFKLFEYWFWTYSFQNASMYEHIGIMKEQHFRKELFRLIFIGKLFDYDTNNITCPLYELQNYWERYFFRLSQEIEFFFQSKKNNTVFIQPFKLLIVEQFGSTFNRFIKDPQKFNALLQKFDYEIDHDDPSSRILRRLFSDAAYTKFTEGNKSESISGARSTQLALITEKYNALRNFSVLSFKYQKIFAERYTQNILSGKPILFSVAEHLDSIFFVRSLMNLYLNLLFQKNNFKTRFLRRNWLTGEPLQGFIQIEDPDFLYAVDQTGSTFFYEPQNANEYFKIRNGLMQSLWHFSMVHKGNLFTKLESEFYANP